MIKRILGLILVFALSFGGAIAANQAWESMKEPETVIGGDSKAGVIVTNKEVYQEGEPIYVTIWSDNPMDKVRVYRSGDATNQIAYWRVGERLENEDEIVQGPGSGVRVDISTRYTSDYADLTCLEPGKYFVVLIPNGGTISSTNCVYAYFTVAADE